MASIEVRHLPGAPELTGLRLEGDLRPGWCGNLATGLAAREIAIVSGRAVALGAGRWQASFRLRCTPAQLPEADALAGLLERDSRAGFTSSLGLLEYRLRESARHGGSLELRVVGRDRTGFLAALLRRLAYFALFPAELALETVAGRAQDCFWLRAGGAGIPTPRTRAALTASLAALCPGPEDGTSPSPHWAEP